MELKALNTLTFGSGPHLVMLHGWNRSLYDLKPLADLLASHCTVHLIDLPGFGKTPPPPEEGWSTEQYADLVKEYIEMIGADEVMLLGHSFGGRISLRIASGDSRRVSRLILIGAHGIKPIRSLRSKFRVWLISKAGKLLKSFDALVGTDFYNLKFAKRFGSADYRNAGKLKNTFIKTIIEDQSPNLGKIKARTLLLWGSADDQTPVSLARRFNELIGDSKLIVLDGKDHFPFHGGGAHLCAHHIISFLKS